MPNVFPVFSTPSLRDVALGQIFARKNGDFGFVYLESGDTRFIFRFKSNDYDSMSASSDGGRATEKTLPIEERVLVYPDTSFRVERADLEFVDFRDVKQGSLCLEGDAWLFAFMQRGSMAFWNMTAMMYAYPSGNVAMFRRWKIVQGNDIDAPLLTASF